RPCAFNLLSLVFLAIAVALFSFGSKASLYGLNVHQYKNFPVAKALIEHRYVDSPGTSYRMRHRGRLQFEISPDASLAQAPYWRSFVSSYAPRYSAIPRSLPF